jgi:hypothetical protein
VSMRRKGATISSDAVSFRQACVNPRAGGAMIG